MFCQLLQQPGVILSLVTIGALPDHSVEKEAMYCLCMLSSAFRVVCMAFKSKLFLRGGASLFHRELPPTPHAMFWKAQLATRNDFAVLRAHVNFMHVNY